VTEIAVEPRHRLHPLSPLLRSARLIALVIAGISFQGYAELGPLRWLGVVVVVLIGAIALSVVSWFFTGYHVIGRELRIYEGLVWRRTRAIPLERLQAVDVVRPLLARLAGLAELKLEVVGAAKAEAPLAYLPVADAVALRDRLLALSTGTVASQIAPDGAEVPAPADREILTVANFDVLVSQLLTPQVWALPLGILFVVAQFAFDPVWTFIGVASFLTATIGVVLQPARRVLADWDFRISLGPAGLRLRRGLLDKRTQTIPPHRVQAIGVTWPLLWRLRGWVRSRIDVAGYGHGESQEAIQGGRLLPVGTEETARYVVGEVLPGVDIAALPLTPPPRRARWVAPLRRRILGSALTDLVFATRDGLVTRELVVVPYVRIQSVRVVQGPLQRRVRVASVHADTAGGLHAVAEHRDVGEAWALAAELSERARLARAAAAA
jgi:putative membrane protein